MSKLLRWKKIVGILTVVALLLGVSTLVFAQGGPGSEKRQHQALLAGKDNVGTSNPLAFDAPIVIPPTAPTVVNIAANASFGNAPPPLQTTVNIPSGPFKTAILTITGTQKGRQFDRLMLIWIDNSQIFTGVTPEPTANGIAWTVRKDISTYLPLLSGTRTFTTFIDNFVTSTFTGIPVVSVSLALYPQQGNPLTNADIVGKQNQPDTIVPLTTTPNMVTVHPHQALTATLNLPNDVRGAFLDLYAIAQIGDEFWWAQTPAFRELEVSIDGKPAGMVWPFPFIYTGGVNPFLWRPISGINTLNMPGYRLNLTPFAGLLNGQHTITVNVLNNQDFWLLSGSLLLQEDHGHATSGMVALDTLNFPTSAQSSTTSLIASTNPSTNSQINIAATTQYEIRGQINTSHGIVTADVKSSLNFSNDQINTNPDNWEVVHGFQQVITDENLTDPIAGKSSGHTDEMYTIDSASAFIQTSQSQNAFLLPANLSQTLNIVRDVTRSGLPDFHSSLNMNLEAFANLQNGDAAANIPNVALGSTTAQANFTTSEGLFFRHVLAAHAGTVNMDQLQSNFKNG